MTQADRSLRSYMTSQPIAV